MPRISGKDVLRALRHAGWYVDEVEGSHHHLRHPERPGKVTVPVHGTSILKLKIVGAILDQAGLTVGELEDLR